MKPEIAYYENKFLINEYFQFQNYLELYFEVMP